MSITDFITSLPSHKCGLHLTHNQHKDYYEKVSEAISSNTYALNDWINDVQRALAIANDEVWSLQWYPHTPVGCYIWHAYSLEALLTFVQQNPVR